MSEITRDTRAASSAGLLVGSIIGLAAMKPAMLTGMALAGPIGATVAGIGCVLWSAFSMAEKGETQGYSGVARSVIVNELHHLVPEPNRGN